jgi:hypothetical protein
MATAKATRRRKAPFDMKTLAAQLRAQAKEYEARMLALRDAAAALDGKK